MDSDVLLWTSQEYIWFHEHTLQVSLSQILVSIPTFYFQFMGQLYDWAMFTLLHRGTSDSVNWLLKCPCWPPVVSIFILTRRRAKTFIVRLGYFILHLQPTVVSIFIFCSSGTHLTVFFSFILIISLPFLGPQMSKLGPSWINELSSWKDELLSMKYKTLCHFLFSWREEWKGLGWNKSYTILGASSLL